MRMVIQRVKTASVEVDHSVVGSIQAGLMVLVGFQNSDHEELIQKMAEKLFHLRIFEDEQGKMNCSISDINQAALLIVPQFTLYADPTTGRRPGLSKAAPPSVAEPMFRFFCQALTEFGIPVEKGQFGAYMQVHLVNDGPFTILFDSDDFFAVKEK